MKAKNNPLRAIIFDLDDTLIDTYAVLITQLEFKAAKKMVQKDSSLPPPEELAASLLELRRKNPNKIENEMQKRIPGITENVLKVRRDVFTKIPLYGLFIEPEVKLFIEKLNHKYHLYLVTEGDRDFQNAKIDQLGIRSYFKEIIIISKDSKESKQAAFLSLLKKNHHTPGEVLVVGNRLDKEIRSAVRLGIPTVWIKHGEGCDMIPDEHIDRADFIVGNILEIQGVISRGIRS